MDPKILDRMAPSNPVPVEILQMTSVLKTIGPESGEAFVAFISSSEKEDDDNLISIREELSDETPANNITIAYGDELNFVFPLGDLPALETLVQKLSELARQFTESAKANQPQS